jgi:hypothetical protein
MKTNFTEALQSLDFIKRAIEDAYERGYRDAIDKSAIATTHLEDKSTKNFIEKHGDLLTTSTSMLIKHGGGDHDASY